MRGLGVRRQITEECPAAQLSHVRLGDGRRKPDALLQHSRSSLEGRRATNAKSIRTYSVLGEPHFNLDVTRGREVRARRSLVLSKMQNASLGRGDAAKELAC